MKKIVSVILVCILMVGVILSVTSCTGSVIEDGTYAWHRVGYINCYMIFDENNIYGYRVNDFYDEFEMVFSYKITEERFFIELEDVILLNEDLEEDFEEEREYFEEEIEEDIIENLDGKKIKITNTGFVIGEMPFIKMK